MKIRKGFRKVFICIIGFIWATITSIGITLLVYYLFPKNPEIITPMLVAILGFGSSIVLYLFAANSVEHHQENKYNKVINNNEQELL